MKTACEMDTCLAVLRLEFISWQILRLFCKRFSFIVSEEMYWDFLLFFTNGSSQSHLVCLNSLISIRTHCINLKHRIAVNVNKLDCQGSEIVHRKRRINDMLVTWARLTVSNPACMAGARKATKSVNTFCLGAAFTASTNTFINVWDM